MISAISPYRPLFPYAQSGIESARAVFGRQPTPPAEIKDAWELSPPQRLLREIQQDWLPEGTPQKTLPGSGDIMIREALVRGGETAPSLLSPQTQRVTHPHYFWVRSAERRSPNGEKPLPLYEGVWDLGTVRPIASTPPVLTAENRVYWRPYSTHSSNGNTPPDERQFSTQPHGWKHWNSLLRGHVSRVTEVFVEPVGEAIPSARPRRAKAA